MGRHLCARRLAHAVILAGAASCAAQRGSSATPDIALDQVGYAVTADKVALITRPASAFTVRRVGDDATVLTGVLGAATTCALSGDSVQRADFTALREPGSYYVDVPGVGRSWPFTVADDPHGRAYDLAMRGFYGLRCGTAVDLAPAFPGYAHAACHRTSAFHPSAGASAVPAPSGGWHDAGDYGRYLPTTAVSVATLLLAWDLFADRLAPRQLDQTQGGGGTPTLLDEARWGLTWMLAMQDADGGVWHKQTSDLFPGFVMPERDPLPVRVIGVSAPPYKSSCATAALAAVGAMAARVYASSAPELASRSLDSARRAWAWVENHPAVYFANPPGVVTGEYGDRDCSDERLWAAVELWRATDDTTFHRYFLDRYTQYLGALDAPPAEAWREVAQLALWSYALTAPPATDAGAMTAIRARVLAAGQAFAGRAAASPYRVSLTAGDFVWGSNAVAANYAMAMLIADHLSPAPALRAAALDHVHYLLGRNTFSLSFVTQVGAHALRHPHHRPSGADQNPEPWPGLLAGGPNAARQDPVLAALSPRPAARTYVDDEGSFAGNEVAINWQAMWVFALAGQLSRPETP